MKPIKTTPLRLARAFFLSCSLILAPLALMTSCGGSGGGIFSGVARVIGQATRPVTGVIDSNPLPLAQGVVRLVDFADEATGRLARVQEVGTTDENGNFDVSIPGQTIAAIVIDGNTDQGPVQISGLVNPDREEISKNLDPITTVACEAGISSIVDGVISDDQLDAERVKNLEDASADYLAANTVNVFDRNQVLAAARAVREATNAGANPAPEGAFTQSASTTATPTPTPSPTPTTAEQEATNADQTAQCSGGQFNCADGTVICAEQVCNSVANCPDGTDESSALCSDETSCCTATAGCPTETAQECDSSCCCCNINQVCDRANLQNGCIASTSRSSTNPLSKLFLRTPYY